ncbi:MAG: general stress protein CsbD [Betaproteobacteria bacterium RIFCSPLOWO2_02_64_14]|nr:MAG: general stress protein CsbD [Betaproteobacteria bacterium RIFCSPLOWO2_02_64_14]
MNRDRFEGNWKQFSGAVKEQWGRLTDDLQREFAGRHDQLAGRMQERHGISKEESERQLRDFLDRNRKWDLSNM